MIWGKSLPQVGGEDCMHKWWQSILLLCLTCLLGSSTFAQTSVGLGGGGSIYAPAVAPYNSSIIFVSCDMTGLYRSTDGGLHWTMMDERAVQGSTSFSVAFDPTTQGHIIGFHPGLGMRESFDTGTTWSAFSPGLPSGAGSITAAAFSTDNPTKLVVGTSNGLYVLQNGVWQAGPTGNFLRVIFVTDPSLGHQVAYAATSGAIYQLSSSGSWNIFSSGLPIGGSELVTDIAGGADATHYALYAAISTASGQLASSGGVYRYASNNPSWTRQVNGLNGGNGSITRDPDCDTGTDPQYQLLGVAAAQPDSAYVTAINTTCKDYVYKGTFSSGAMSWSPVYDGFQNHTTNNLTPGWIEMQPPWGLGWGFGGGAHGFAVAPGDFNTAVYVNNAAVHITTNGAAQWVARYTSLATGTAGTSSARWQTTGVDVTSSWYYYAHPDPNKATIHFIANTDMALSRSVDSGSTWVPIFQGGGSSWNTFYQLAFEYPAGTRIWAAVSSQHDIPQETQLGAAPGNGTVLVSTDDGATWNSVVTSGLPAGPVVSIIYNAGTLYASVWGNGVYSSADGGSTWTQVGSSSSFPTDSNGHVNKHVYQLRFDAAGSLYVVIAADNTQASILHGGLYKLVSGSWQKLSSGLETLLGQRGATLAPYDYLIDPTNSDLIYVCAGDVPRSNGGFGVYKYSQSANTWTDMGLQNAIGVADSQVAFAPFLINGTFYVTTMGDGIWQTTNGGSTWSEYKGIPFLSPQRITMVGTQMYITTFGGGVWKPGTSPPPPPPGPTATMTAPTAGSTVSGTITLSATASDPSGSGIAGVTFLVDGTATGAEVTTAPYTMSFNTTTLSNGNHTFSARARNNNNATGTSSGDTVNVQNTVGQGQLTLTAAEVLSPASPAVNQSTTATFTVQNTGTAAMTVQSFVAAGRDPSNANVDFPATAPVTLQPGQSYTYSQSRSFATAGTYSTWPSWWDGTNWFNLATSSNFTVTQPALFSDNFNRTTGLGANWSVFAGSYTTNGTQAVSGTMTTSGTGNWAKVTAALGTNNYAVAADIIVPAGSLDSGLVARSNDSVNFDSTLYSAQIATDGHVNLYRRNAWSWTLLSSVATTITAGTSYNLKLITTGSSPVHLEVWLNGVQKIVFNDSSTSQITSGAVGMINYDTSVKYDNFTVTQQ
jgi:Bacterial Ig domain